MNLTKRRENIIKRKRNKHIHLLKQDIKRKYLKGDSFYCVTNNSTQTFWIGEIEEVIEIVDKYLHKCKVKYHKKFIKEGTSVIGKCYFEFGEEDNNEKNNA